MSGYIPPGIYKGHVLFPFPNQHACKVQFIVNRDDTDHTVAITVPMLATGVDPHLRGGEVYLPKPGESVIVNAMIEDCPFIMGSLPEFSDREDQRTSANAATSESNSAEGAAKYHNTLDPKYGAADPISSRMGGESYRGGRSGELMPGDWARYGTDGNMLGVLEGGVNVIKSSDRAQVQTNAANDSVRIVANNLELLSSFGEITVTSDEGKAGLKIRGNPNTARANPEQPEWTMELDLGRFGAPFFRLDLNNGKAGIKIEPSGEVSIYGTKLNQSFQDASPNAIATNASSANVDIAGDDIKRVNNTYSREVGDHLLTVGNSSTTTVTGGTHKLTVAQGDRVVSSKRLNDSVSGYSDILKDGPPVPGLFISREVSTRNGLHKVVVGDPNVRITNPLFAPSYLLDTYSGDIKLTANDGGAVVLSSVNPVSPTVAGGVGAYGIVLSSPRVLLGGLPLPPSPQPLPNTFPVSVNPAILFQTLIAYITSMHSFFDSHVHPTAVGPSGVPVVPMSGGLAPYANPEPNTNPLASRSVFLGS